MWFTLTAHGSRHTADADTAAPTSGLRPQTSDVGAARRVQPHHKFILPSHDATRHDTHVIREHMYMYVYTVTYRILQTANWRSLGTPSQCKQCNAWDMGYDTIRYDTIRYDTPLTISISGPESSRNTDMDTDSDRDRDMNTAGSRKGDKRYSPPHGHGPGRQEHRST